MRTALLAAVKRTDTGELRAELVLGGRSVLAWQVELVRALGCERIICQCEAPRAEILATQRRVEAEGGEFHSVRGNLQIVSLLRADDELVILRDGLLADRANVLAHAISETASGRPLRGGIATIPSSHPLTQSDPEDFERIDRDRHWAGFAVMRAVQAQKLADMPPDSEAVSLLLRIALQSHVECRELPATALEGGNWLLATSGAALERAETELVEAHARIPAWSGPTQALAATLVRQIAPRGLEKGREFSAIAAVLLVISGTVLAGFGLGVWGLAVVAMGAFAGALSGAWGGLRGALWSEAGGSRADFALVAAIDVLAAISLVLAYGFDASPLPQLALPLLAVGLARYLSGAEEGALAAFWGDRTTHLASFAVAAGLGYLGEVLAVFALGALLQLVLRPRRF